MSVSSSVEQEILDAPMLRLGIRTVRNLSIARGYYTGTNVENSIESFPDLDVTMDTNNKSTSSDYLEAINANIL